MKAFLDSPSATIAAAEANAQRSVVTLHLLLVVEHEWKLFFACDRGDRMDVVGDMSIGVTKSIMGLYPVVAVLHGLVKWLGTVLGNG
jgi:hypothetical protein